MCDLLQNQLDEETSRLKEVEEKRANDIAFVENAHYTSNEEGMGVSPTTYEDQNRIARPGNRLRTPPRDPRIQDDSLDQLEKSIERIMPEVKIVKAKKSEKS